MEKQEILKNIKQEALENHVPILQDISLDFILLILKLAKPNKILEIGTKSVELDVHESKNYKIKVIYTYDLGNGNEITEIKTY